MTSARLSFDQSAGTNGLRRCDAHGDPRLTCTWISGAEQRQEQQREHVRRAGHGVDRQRRDAQGAALPFMIAGSAIACAEVVEVQRVTLHVLAGGQVLEGLHDPLDIDEAPTW